MAELASDCKRHAEVAPVCFGSVPNGDGTFDHRCDSGQNFPILYAREMAPIMTSEPVRLFLEVMRRAHAFLAGLVAERRCAMRLDRVADRLASMGGRINLLRARMHDGMVDEAIDTDFMLRDALRGLKDDIRSIRCQLAGMRVADLSRRLQRAFARLSQIAADTYASADRLQWEIADHDRRY
jgi:hypothetical protein